ncbi:dihydrodipicolinate reductase C-terminal domain-containing protein [Candidatus Vidania fulgoroideorum]
MIKILLSGYTGDVGKKIFKILTKEKNINLKYFLNKKNSKRKIKNYVKKSDLIIDFSIKHFAIKLLKWCNFYKKKIIIGTTGFSKNELKKIKIYSKTIPIFLDYNMNDIFQKFLSILKYSFRILNKMDSHLIEIHKKKKKDYPSGSYYKICGIAEKKLSFSSIRLSNEIGVHKIIFQDKFNKITMSHSGLKKCAFLKNIKNIIFFIIKKRYGLFNIKNI